MVHWWLFLRPTSVKQVHMRWNPENTKQPNSNENNHGAHFADNEGKCLSERWRTTRLKGSYKEDRNKRFKTRIQEICDLIKNGTFEIVEKPGIEDNTRFFWGEVCKFCQACRVWYLLQELPCTPDLWRWPSAYYWIESTDQTASISALHSLPGSIGWRSEAEWLHPRIKNVAEYLTEEITSKYRAT